MTRTAGIIFSTLTKHQEATRIVLKNHNKHPVALVKLNMATPATVSATAA
jgi:hypothetical protein